MEREDLVKRFDALARWYQQMHDPQLREQLQRLSFKILEFDNVMVLKHALGRSRDEDLRTKEVEVALAFLEHRSFYKSPFIKFRQALTSKDSESRWRILNGAVNGIMLVLGLF